MIAARMDGTPMFAMSEDTPCFPTLEQAETFQRGKLEGSRAEERQILIYVPTGVRHMH